MSGRGEEGEAGVFAGKLVGTVDPDVAAVTEGSFVGATEHGGLVGAADIAEYLHLSLFP